MYAIIENGSKQYKVAVDDVVKFEKLNAKVGDKVSFNVLLVSDENGIKTTAEAAKYVAEGEVLAQDKEKKIIVYKYKAKKDYRKKNGHRQPYTLVKVTDIVSGGQKAAAAEKQDDVKPSMSMKKEELLAIANEKGIEVSSKATKAEILEAIEA